MITYISKKKSFVITALLCDLFTSIIILYVWQQHICICMSSVRSPLLPPQKKKNPVRNPAVCMLLSSSKPTNVWTYMICYVPAMHTSVKLQLQMEVLG